MTLARQFAAYTEWRTELFAGLAAFKKWLPENDLGDAQTELRIGHMLEKLREDRLHVAFVAEFSRGKTELINAIFFAEYGSRILPSTAGRTTMCPTELMYDATRPAGIDLLPIETRETSTSISEYRHLRSEWKNIALNVDSAESMQEALHSVSDVLRVLPEQAEALGFSLNDEGTHLISLTDDGMVEIPRWRHAIINFPHPLLQQGLVILDTPGLNAIGTEPELTLSLLPNAQAVLFVLAADAGVTLSDRNLWNEHIGVPGKRKKGRLVVLNKIDSMWDELKSEKEINAEITRQAESCAATLGLPLEQVFPVSAQKALVAKITADPALLARSRLLELERALSEELIPAKQEIICESTELEFSDIHGRTQNLLASRLLGVHEQLSELCELRGKNRGVVSYMMGKVNIEKEEFESGLQHHYAVRSVFSQLTNKLFSHLGLDALRLLTSTTRAKMTEATFSKTLSGAMKHFFTEAKVNLDKSEAEIHEILRMMEAMSKKLSVEHGLKLGAPNRFSLARYRLEVERLEAWCGSHLSSMFSLVVSEKSKVTHKFFDEVALQVRRAFEHANQEAEIWLKAIMSPMDTQVREHQIQLKQRLESIKRIHQATDTLESRIEELHQIESNLEAQILSLESLGEHVRQVLSQTVVRPNLRSAA